MPKNHSSVIQSPKISPQPTTKKHRSSVPLPQQIRIRMRHVAGESNRKIARAEGRDRSTISRIIKSSEMAAFVEEMKERFRGLAPEALSTVEYALVVQRDAKIAYEVLRDIGVIPGKGVPEQVQPISEEEGQTRQALMVADLLLEGNKMFGVDLPDGVAEKLEQMDEEESKSSK